MGVPLMKEDGVTGKQMVKKSGNDFIKGLLNWFNESGGFGVFAKSWHVDWIMMNSIMKRQGFVKVSCYMKCGTAAGVNGNEFLKNGLIG